MGADEQEEEMMSLHMAGITMDITLVWLGLDDYIIYRVVIEAVRD